jgi:hypothetical protein
LLISDNLNNPVINASWSYPYNLRTTAINTDLNQTQDFLSLSNDVKPSAEFFVFTGVTSMLLSLGFLVLYVFMDRQYRNDERFPIVDLIITLIWTIFWIAGSSAWGQGVSNIRTQTSIDYVTSLVTDCAANPNECLNSSCKSFSSVFEFYLSFIFSWYICQCYSISYIWIFEFSTLAWFSLVCL